MCLEEVLVCLEEALVCLEEALVCLEEGASVSLFTPFLSVQD